MEHIFILNPQAGKHGAVARMEAQARALGQRHGLNVTCHQTPSGADATALVRSLCETGREFRFYACGGDGTLHHVVAGAAGFANAAVTCIPLGSGNDFLRNFGEDRELFADPENLWDGDVHTLDLIDCNGKTCLTIACFGIDARVGADVHRFKRLPLVWGRLAYLLAVARNVLRPIGRHWTLIADGAETAAHLAVVATCNGRYYGGGSCPIPQARLDDGIVETILVDNISALTFAKLFPIYSQGHHERIAKYARIITPKTLEIRSKTADIPVCLDGEVSYSDHACITCSPHKIRFFAPKNTHPNATATPW